MSKLHMTEIDRWLTPDQAWLAPLHHPRHANSAWLSLSVDWSCVMPNLAGVAKVPCKFQNRLHSSSKSKASLSSQHGQTCQLLLPGQTSRNNQASMLVPIPKIVFSVPWSTSPFPKWHVICRSMQTLQITRAISTSPIDGVSTVPSPDWSNEHSSTHGFAEPNINHWSHFSFFVILVKMHIK